MKWLQNIKMFYKFLLVAAICTAFTICIGVFAIYKLGVSNHDSDYIYRNNLLAVVYLSSMQTFVLQNGSDIAEHMASSDRKTMDRLEGQIAERAVLFNQMLASYKQTDLSPAEKTALAKLEISLAEYRSGREDLFVASRKAISELSADLAAADAIYLEVCNYRDSTVLQMEELVKINQNVAKEMNASIKASYLAGVRLFIILIVIAVVISLFFCYFAASGVTSVLKVVTKIVSNTANLDLVYDNSAAKLLNHQDELGDIARGVGQMRV